MTLDVVVQIVGLSAVGTDEEVRNLQGDSGHTRTDAELQSVDFLQDEAECEDVVSAVFAADGLRTAHIGLFLSRWCSCTVR